MRRTICLIACCFLGPVAIAGEPTDTGGKLTDPKKILERAAEVVKEAKLVKYTASYKGTNWARRFVPDMEMKVLAGEPAEYDVPRYFCSGTVTRDKPPAPEEAASDEESAPSEKAPETETVSITAGCNGDEYYLINKETKTVHMDMDPAVLGTKAGDVRRVFIAANAFDNVLKAEEVELKAETEIGGEPCYEIHAKVAQGPLQSEVWVISTRDLFPRHVKRIYKTEDFGDEVGTTELTLTELVTNPKLGKDPFTPKVPEGFKKTDEFAP